MYAFSAQAVERLLSVARVKLEAPNALEAPVANIGNWPGGGLGGDGGGGEGGGLGLGGGGGLGLGGGGGVGGLGLVFTPPYA